MLRNVAGAKDLEQSWQILMKGTSQYKGVPNYRNPYWMLYRVLWSASVEQGIGSPPAVAIHRACRAILSGSGTITLAGITNIGAIFLRTSHTVSGGALAKMKKLQGRQHVLPEKSNSNAPMIYKAVLNSADLGGLSTISAVSESSAATTRTISFEAAESTGSSGGATANARIWSNINWNNRIRKLKIELLVPGEDGRH
ncbi:hypothetical protein M434DRAFT_9977 [Hypoxylon sp. CO27-5]|nr:hypothetical protein M434DRAFT_9977 [Hypoxylon sp. CO27-5]